MRSLYLSIFCGVVVAGLSGCNASSTVTTSPGQTNPPQPPVPPQPNIPAAVLAFESLAAIPSSAVITSPSLASPLNVVVSDTTPGDGKIEVTIGSNAYQLDGSMSGGNPIFSGTTAGTSASVTQVAQESDVALSLITEGTGAVDDPVGYSALGTVTSAAELANLVGAAGASAVYKGTSSLVATHENNLRELADGNLVLNVDFENSTFDGSMDLTSTVPLVPGVMNFDITAVNASISNGLITNGSLNGDLTVLDGNPADFLNGANQLGMDLSSVGTLSGDFFGQDAKNVGGTFSFSGTEPDQFGLNPPMKIEVQGGFVGTK